MARRLVFVAVFAAALLGASHAGAQDAAEDARRATDTAGTDDEARGLFLAGSAAFEQGRYEEALEYFQRSHELSGRPGLLFNIGHTAERLRRDELALEMFERYLRDSPEADNRSAVEARIRLLRESIARGAESPVEPTGPEPPRPPPAEAPKSDGPGLWPILVLGAGAAVAVGGAVLLGVAASSANEVDSADAGTPWPDVEGDYDDARTLSVLGGVLLGVGAAVAVSGAAWLVLGSGGGEHEVDVAVLPGGLVVRGTL